VDCVISIRDIENLVGFVAFASSRMLKCDHDPGIPSPHHSA
jgi:hypothetical protein